MSRRKPSHPVTARPWDTRLVLENLACTPEAWNEAVAFVKRIPGKKVTEFRIIVCKEKSNA